MSQGNRSTLWGILPIALTLACIPSSGQAAEGEPMAVRAWPGGAVTLETHWGHKLVLVSGSKEQLPDGAKFALEPGKQYDHVLSRPANAAKTKLVASAEATKDPNGVVLRTLEQGTVVVTADGVTILIVALNSPPAGELPKRIDLAILAGDVDSQRASGIARAVGRVKPRSVLIVGAVDESAAPILEEAGTLDRIDHNSLALVASKEGSGKTRFVQLAETPWKMPAELASEFEAMEKSCAESQKVFAKLSTEQMNFRPENGTHTPRWNAEHMMGRQLGFFSQIYHSVDSAMPVMDLNPKQMPPDYQFAHSDWTGAEEARQMQRVSDYTRRFAYLLDGKKLSDKATGTFWPSIGALLRQMQRHYGEHTANTVKKFELPGFPKS